MQVTDCNNQVWRLDEVGDDVQLAIQIDGVGFEPVAYFDDTEQALAYITETSGEPISI